MRSTLISAVVGLSALAAPHAAAQFIIENTQFGHGNVSTEARTAEDFASDGDSLSFNHDQHFEDLTASLSKISQLPQSTAYADQVQSAWFGRGPRSMRITSSSCISAMGWSDPAEDQTPNTADARSEASFVLVFEATERFELHLQAGLVASSSGLGDSLAQIFIYGPDGIVIADAAATRNDGFMVRNIDQRYTLNPGGYVVEIIGFSDARTWADQEGGTENSSVVISWFIDADLKAAPRLWFQR
ncbi:MAG: hypothetical protein H6811_01705 [Phycisphaeraceae bacterium]|nr:hypothetical protein [Phycisphaeraceae bacterium]